MSNVYWICDVYLRHCRKFIIKQGEIMNSFSTKYIISIIILTILIIVFRDPEIAEILRNLLGCIILLAFVETMNILLNKAKGD